MIDEVQNRALYHSNMHGKHKTAMFEIISNDIISACWMGINSADHKVLSDLTDESLYHTSIFEQRKKDGAFTLDSDAPHHQHGDATASSSELIILPQKLRVERKDDHGILH